MSWPVVHCEDAASYQEVPLGDFPRDGWMKVVLNYFRELTSATSAGWNRFWFTPDQPHTLAVIRICAGAMLFYTHAVWSIDFIGFFGPDGRLAPEFVRAFARHLVGVESFLLDRFSVDLVAHPWGGPAGLCTADGRMADELDGTVVVFAGDFLCQSGVWCLVWIGPDQSDAQSLPGRWGRWWCLRVGQRVGVANRWPPYARTSPLD